MSFTEHDYEQVASYLDGRSVDLTADQRDLLRRFETDQGRVRLDVTMPPGTLHRVNHRLAAAGRVQHHRAWWRWGSAAAAAMVAAFLLSGQWPTNTSGSLGASLSADEYVRAFLHEGGGEFRDQTSSLSERMLDYELDWAINTPWTVDISVGDAENEPPVEDAMPEPPAQDTWNDSDLIQ